MWAPKGFTIQQLKTCQWNSELVHSIIFLQQTHT